MPFVELLGPEELTEFLNANSSGCVITFSATWCGPCKRSKPQLQALAEHPDTKLPIGYVHEEDLEDFLDVFVKISAFPTYIVFVEGKEVQRVQGVDFEALQEMIQANAPSTTTKEEG